jgi:predicted enzyme involved in methoxymalonyl-ACP biosynthesis
MKTKHILIGLAGIGLIYYFYNKTHIKENDVKLNSFNPITANNQTAELKAIRNNLHEFLSSLLTELDVQHNEEMIVKNVMKITTV